MIFSLLPVKTDLVLSMDRTNWKFGDFNINILMLGVTYKGIAFPLIFSLLPKRGNSNWEERKKIMERFIRLFGHDNKIRPYKSHAYHRRKSCDALHVAHVGVLDVEAGGLHGLGQNFWIVKPSTGERIRAWWLFNDLRVGQEKFYHKLFLRTAPSGRLKHMRICNSGIPSEFLIRLPAR